MAISSRRETKGRKHVIREELDDIDEATPGRDMTRCVVAEGRRTIPGAHDTLASLNSESGTPAGQESAVGGGTCREYRERHPQALFPRQEKEEARYLLPLHKNCAPFPLCTNRKPFHPADCKRKILFATCYIQTALFKRCDNALAQKCRNFTLRD